MGKTIWLVPVAKKFPFRYQVWFTRPPEDRTSNDAQVFSVTVWSTGSCVISTACARPCVDAMRIPHPSASNKDLRRAPPPGLLADHIIAEFYFGQRQTRLK